MKYGLVAAVGMVVWMLGEYALGLHSTRFAIGQYTNFGTELILILVLWRLLHQRIHDPNQYWLPVWRGVLDGMLTSLVAAMGFYVFVSFYLHFLNPDFPDLYLEWRVAGLRAGGQSENEIRQMARSFRWSMGPVGLPVTIFGLYLLIGAIASPLLTLWLNWRRKETALAG